MELISAPCGILFRVLYIGYFSKRTRKPAKFQEALLLSKTKQLSKKTIVSLCLAGRFSVVLRAGSWPDLRVRVWGYVRLFLYSGVASCVDCHPSEATVFLLKSSANTYFFFAGKPLVRQLPRAFESFSRNGSFILYSGISVFKNPRIIDK